MVRWLIEKAVLVNEAQDKQQWTPLHWATQRGDLHLVSDALMTRFRVLAHVHVHTDLTVARAVCGFGLRRPLSGHRVAA